MKRWLALASLAAFTAAAICTLLSGWPTRCLLVPLKAFAASSPAAVVSIDELMKNADHYPGLVRVVGVVSALSRQQQTIILADTQELQGVGLPPLRLLPCRSAGLAPCLYSEISFGWKEWCSNWRESSSLPLRALKKLCQKLKE